MTSRNRLLAVAMLLTGLMLRAAPAAAEVMVYPYDRAGFQSQLSEFTTYGFEAGEGFAIGRIEEFANGLIRSYQLIHLPTRPSVRYPAFIKGHPYEPETQVLGSAQLVGPLPVPHSPFVLEFTGPVYAVGFDMVNLSPVRADIAVHVADGPGALMFAFTDNDADFTTEAFWGIVSSSPIASMSITDVRSEISDSAETLDDLTISVVPEPAGVVVGVCTALSLGARRGRRSSGEGIGHALEPLEGRLMLTGAPVASPASDYLPPQTFLFQDRGYLSGSSRSSAFDVAMNYVASHAASLKLDPSDLREYRVTDQYTDHDTGVTHIYLRQQLNGLDILNTTLSINVAKDGRIINVGGGFVSGLAQIAAQPGFAAAPILTVTDALARAGEQLYPTEDRFTVQVLSPAAGVERRQILSDRDLSLKPIPGKLVYVPKPDGVKLAWNFTLRTPDQRHLYDASVDASTGQLLVYHERVRGVTHTYNAVPLPRESPLDGGRTLVTDPDPAGAVASPYRWHDTNGVEGDEYSDTQGNNVSAQWWGPPAFRPSGAVQGSSNLVFDFVFDPAQEWWVGQNPSAAVTNLF